MHRDGKTTSSEQNSREQTTAGASAFYAFLERLQPSLGNGVSCRFGNAKNYRINSECWALLSVVMPVFYN